MKITKRQLKEMIKEEISEAIGAGSAMPVGGALLEPDGPVVIVGASGTFNMDVVVDGQSLAITGQLHPDVVEELIDAGVLQLPR